MGSQWEACSATVFLFILLACAVSCSAFTPNNGFSRRIQIQRGSLGAFDGDYAYDDLLGRINNWLDSNMLDAQNLRSAVLNVLEAKAEDFQYRTVLEDSQQAIVNMMQTISLSGQVDSSTIGVLLSCSALIIVISSARKGDKSSVTISTPYLNGVYNAEVKAMYSSSN